MPHTRAPSPPEFREQIVELARNGRSMADLAQEFEPCYATILRWVQRANQADEPETDENGDLKRLRRENRQLRQEREISAEVTRWLARDFLPQPGTADLEVQLDPPISLRHLEYTGHWQEHFNFETTIEWEGQR